MERKAAELQNLTTELSQVKVELEHLETQINKLLERQQLLIERKDEIAKAIKTVHAKESGEERSIDWGSRSFSWTENAEKCLREIFKLAKFRALQRDAINATMSGVDCIVLMPTGAGKSLCFQLPAVLSKGLTLVVSPLISLIEDQLISLSELNIEATLLNASSTKEQTKYVHDLMISKGPMLLKLLYVTPEKIAKSKRFLAKLEKCYNVGNLSRIVIDEVHCLSQWGHDFRPDYKILGILKKQFPNLPVIGLTATATGKVIDDVMKMLSLNEGCVVLRTSFNRPNLFYEVRPSPSSEKDQICCIASTIQSEFKNQSGIVYCYSRREADTLTIELRKYGIRAACYHADLDFEVKSKNHRNWISKKVQVIVATIAFGMGIDKPDVRFVIHNSISKSIQNYYQESGRAGRDSKLSHCILFFKFSDVFRQISSVFMEQTGTENLHAMIKYCITLKCCRRTSLGKHFGEAWGKDICKQMCDNCRTSANGYISKDITKYATDLTAILQNAAKRKERLTPNKLLDAWLQQGPVPLRVPELRRPDMSREDCERVIVKFVLDEVLKEDIHFTPYNNICYLVEGPRISLATRGKIALSLDFKYEATETESSNPDIHETFASPKSASATGADTAMNKTGNKGTKRKHSVGSQAMVTKPRIEQIEID